MNRRGQPVSGVSEEGVSIKDIAENEGYGSLEWTYLPDGRGKNDQQVEEDARNGEKGDDGGDGPAEIPHISGQRGGARLNDEA